MLWKLVQEATERALASGALQAIRTRESSIHDSGVDFMIRRVSSLARKQEQTYPGEASVLKKPENPFLPFEEDLFVS
ncbi:phosphorylase, partial [Fibrobacterota bacterium]